MFISLEQTDLLRSANVGAAQSTVAVLGQWSLVKNGNPGFGSHKRL
jgi:hypothetical protein